MKSEDLAGHETLARLEESFPNARVTACIRLDSQGETHKEYRVNGRPVGSLDDVRAGEVGR